MTEFAEYQTPYTTIHSYDTYSQRGTILQFPLRQDLEELLKDKYHSNDSARKFIARLNALQLEERLLLEDIDDLLLDIRNRGERTCYVTDQGLARYDPKKSNGVSVYTTRSGCVLDESEARLQEQKVLIKGNKKEMSAYDAIIEYAVEYSK